MRPFEKGLLMKVKVYLRCNNCLLINDLSYY